MSLGKEQRGMRGDLLQDEFSDEERLQILKMPLPPGSTSFTITDLTFLTISFPFCSTLFSFGLHNILFS